MGHAKDVLARFQSGERRLIFARVRGADPTALVELPQGEAASWRSRTTAELLCPIPDCEDPRLRAVSRAPRRRDGFSHLPGAGGHDTESLFHLQGKARVVAWLRQRHPEFVVRMEQASDRERTRVADVMATAPDGTRYAFEVQYASLTIEEWAARDQSYRDQRIIPVWLFGHHGRQLRIRGGDRIELTPVQREIRDRKRSVLWLNPLTAEIGVATKDVPPFGRIELGDDGELRTEALEQFWLDRTGLHSPGLDNLTLANNAFLAHVEREARERAEAEQRRRDAHEQRRADAERAAAARAWLDEQRRRGAWDRSRDEREQRFRKSVALGPRALAEATRVLTQDPSELSLWGDAGRLPVWFTAAQPTVIGGLPASHWRALLYLELIADPKGPTFNRDQAVTLLLDYLVATPHSRSHVRTVVTEWCDILAAHQVLHRVVDRNGTAHYAYDANFVPPLPSSTGVPRCRLCRRQLAAVWIDAGYDAHPLCLGLPMSEVMKLGPRPRRDQFLH